MRIALLILAFIGTIAVTTHTVAAEPGVSGPGVSVEVRASGRHAPAGSAVTQPTSVYASTAGTHIQVTYIDFPDDARSAVEYAASIWEALIVSPVTITVEIRWEELEAGLWGVAGFERTFRNFSGAPLRDVWYPVPLANAIAGRDLQPGSPDIGAKFNSEVNWYLGTDGEAPDGTVDLVTLALHEFGHGLGFGSTFEMNGLLGRWGGDAGLPLNYDLFVENGRGQNLTDTALFPNPSVLLLGGQLTSDDLFFAGPESIAANGGSPPSLYAPEPWAPLSSVLHLDEDTFPTGSPNSMLTPFFDFGEVMHVPGPVVMAMLRDLGWQTSAPAACLGFAAGSLGNGTVKLVPSASPGCSPGSYAPGATVTMVAMAADGWTHTGWNLEVGVAACAGCATTTSTMPNTTQTVVATFQEKTLSQRLVVPQIARASADP